MVLDCNFRSLPFLGFIGFLLKAAKSLIYSYPPECSQVEVSGLGAFRVEGLQGLGLRVSGLQGNDRHCAGHGHGEAQPASEERDELGGAEPKRSLVGFGVWGLIRVTVGV